MKPTNKEEIELLATLKNNFRVAGLGFMDKNMSYLSQQEMDIYLYNTFRNCLISQASVLKNVYNIEVSDYE